MRVVVFFLLWCFSLTAQASEAVRALTIEGINGPVWVLHDPLTKIVSIEMRYQGGIMLDPSGKEGVGSFLSSMLMRGAGQLNAAAFTEKLRDKAINMDVSMGRDEATISITAPIEFLNDAQRYFYDVVNAPRFDEGELDRAKEEVLAGLRDQKSDPNWRAQRIANDVSYRGTVYARPGSGTPSSVVQLTRDDLKKQHRVIFNHQPISAVIVGAASDDEIKKFFAPLSEKTKVKNVEKPKDFRSLSPARAYFHRYDVPQTSVFYILPAIDRRDPYYAALSVLDAILADGFGSRLMKALREESGLSDGVSSSISAPDHGALWQFSVQTASDKAGQAADILKAVITQTAQEKFTTKEVKATAHSLAAQLPMGWTSSEAISGQLSGAQQAGYSANYLNEWRDTLDRVTPKDVQDVAKRLFDGKSGVMVAVGKTSPDKNWIEIKKLPATE